MLSDKLKKYLKDRQWWYDEESEEYVDAILRLGISKESDFTKFFGHVEQDGPTFYSRNHQLYHVSWFILNSSYINQLEIIRKNFKLSEEYFPLDSFEAEQGFFYNRETGEVIELELGEKLQNFQKGIIDTKWNSFNEFLEWYFEIE